MYFMISSGVRNVPEYLAAVNVEDVMIAYYDSNMNEPEPRQDWAKEVKKEDLQLRTEHGQMIILYRQMLEVATASFKQHTNQTKGMLIITCFCGTFTCIPFFV